MYDNNNYSLDEILNEAKRMKEQKVYGVREDENQPPIIPVSGHSTVAPQKGSIGFEQRQEYHNTEDSSGYENQRREYAPQKRDEPVYEAPASAFPDQRPDYITRQASSQSREAPGTPIAAQRFSMERQTETFGSYVSHAAQPQGEAPREPLRDRYNNGRASGEGFSSIQSERPAADGSREVPRQPMQNERQRQYSQQEQPPQRVQGGVQESNYNNNQAQYGARQEPQGGYSREYYAPESEQHSQEVYNQMPSGMPDARYERPFAPEQNTPVMNNTQGQAVAFHNPELRNVVQFEREQTLSNEYTSPPEETPKAATGFKLRRSYFPEEERIQGSSVQANELPPSGQRVTAFSPSAISPSAISPSIKLQSENVPTATKPSAALPFVADSATGRPVQTPQPERYTDYNTRQFDTHDQGMELSSELAHTQSDANRWEPAPPIPADQEKSGRWEAYRLLEQDNGKHSQPDKNPIDYESFEDDEKELNTPEDVPRVLRMLKLRQLLAFLKIFVLSVTTAAAVYLVLTLTVTALPLPGAISAVTAPAMFAASLFTLSFISFLVSILTVGSGLLALLKFKADGDTMTALASFSTLIYTLSFVIKPELMQNENAHFYCVVAMMGLWFNAVCKYMAVTRIKHNLSVAGSGEKLYAVKIAEDEEFTRNISSVLDEEDPQVIAEYPAGFLKGFLNYSYNDEQIQGTSRVLSPICFAAAVILSFAAYYLYRDILTCFTIFTAVICVCAPFTTLMAVNLPLLRVAKSLTQKGAMLSGVEAVESIAEASAITVNAADLFPEGGITLHGIRTFKGGRIDMSILEAASIMEKVGGTMEDIFFQIIEGRKEILEDVDDIVYEEGMGISAWVNAKRVLIGNRELMRHHGIELPSREYELKYTKDGRDLVYLANSGELSSMFVVSYNAAPAVLKRLRRLEKNNIAVLVKTTDPNITRDKLSDLFELDYDLIRVMPASMHTVTSTMTAEKPFEIAAAATMGSAATMIDTVLAAVKVKDSSSAASAVQLVSVIIGYGLATVITFFYGIALLNPLLLLSYQLIWTMVVLLFISTKSY